MEFDFPHGDTVFYLYEPFSPSAMCAFLARLRDSFHQAPRRAVLLCMGPSLLDTLEETAWLQRRLRLDSPNKSPDWIITIYFSLLADV